MGHFDLHDLDSITRELMLDELELDIATGKLYASRRAIRGSEASYIKSLRNAFSAGDADTLIGELESSGIFANNQSDGKAVNVRAAAEALGDGQFIAYYVRAVCRRALDEGRAVEIYRGENTMQHRPQSDALIGVRPNPADLLAELRNASDEPWKFSAVGKVNSGLSVKLV